MIEQFTPSEEEQVLHGVVADYLRRPTLHSLGSGQHQLISLVLWKLLASSSYAIAGALGTMVQRLEDKSNPSLDDEAPPGLVDDYEALDETAEEWEESATKASALAEEQASSLQTLDQEIAELREFQRQATCIQRNSKGQALLLALDKAFAGLERRDGVNKKALVFTESKRTQTYLLELLEQSPYAGKTVLFNGTNSHPQATSIYNDWLERHAGSDRISGSRS